MPSGGAIAPTHPGYKGKCLNFKNIEMWKILEEGKCKIIPFKSNNIALKVEIKVIQLINSWVYTYFLPYVNHRTYGDHFFRRRQPWQLVSLSHAQHLEALLLVLHKISSGYTKDRGEGNE